MITKFKRDKMGEIKVFQMIRRPLLRVAAISFIVSGAVGCATPSGPEADYRRQQIMRGLSGLNQAFQQNQQNIERRNQQYNQQLWRAQQNRPQKVIIQKQCAWNDYYCQTNTNPSYGY